VDRLDRKRGVGLETEEPADAGEGGVLVLLRVIGKQLGGDQLPRRRSGNDIGERAAAIDPEAPLLSLIGDGTQVLERGLACGWRVIPGCCPCR
jgi:hypothetical protein